MQKAEPISKEQAEWIIKRACRLYEEMASKGSYDWPGAYHQAIHELTARPGEKGEG